MPPDGKSIKGNVKAPPQTPQSTSSCNPPTSDDVRPYVLIRRKRAEVPEAYPKGSEGWLVNDQRFIQELEELLAKDFRDALCAEQQSACKAEGIGHKDCFDLQARVRRLLVVGSTPLLLHAKNVVGLG